MMNLIDTHAHIYLGEFISGRDAMLERAEKLGITKILMPAIDSSTHESMIELEQFRGNFCKSMMGVHPCSVSKEFQNELEIAENYLSQRRFVAIGETGLDFYWDLTYTEQQYESFQRQIDWARKFQLPIVIHSRNAIDECIEMIEKNLDESLKGVFHCFSGSLIQAQRITSMGFYLGIGGVVTFKNAGLDKVMEAMTLDRIILETDAPYLAPVPYRGKQNEPSYIQYVAQKLAGLQKIPVEEVGRITTQNAQALFSI